MFPSTRIRLTGLRNVAALSLAVAAVVIVLVSLTSSTPGYAFVTPSTITIVINVVQPPSK